MHQARLPDGFGIRLDPTVRTFCGGRILVGGSPTRVLELAPTAAAMIGDGYLKVVDPQSAIIARRLLDSGVANPRPMSTPSSRDVTVVLPIHNDPQRMHRLLAALRSCDVVVVDDGSDIPVCVPDAQFGPGRVTVVRHEVQRGVSAARNTGLHTATTPFVAFLDPKMQPRTGWIEVMLGHFSDPAVALVAPRIVGVKRDAGALARYEHARSSLDLGRKESAVCPGGPVAYVPGAAMIGRREVLIEHGGFDESMSVAEDVDLCWRLRANGWRLRYEPISQVAHDHRIAFPEWLGRRISHGTSAAPLAARHADAAPPVSMSAWTLLAIFGAATRSKLGIFSAIATFVITVLRLRATFAALDQPTRIAAIVAARGFVAGAWQFASALCRHYWPLTVLAVLVSPRIRAAAIAIVVAEGLADWLTHREPEGLGPVRYLLFKRLDDIAYGTGVWRGAITAREIEALAPRVSFEPPTRGW